MTKILVLASNPEDTAKLRLEREVRQIEDILERAQNREEFDLKSKLAVRIDDLQESIIKEKPRIVHFCGHGAGSEGLILEAESGKYQLVNNQALGGLFKLFETQVECVMLNACYSQTQAVEINKHINYVIGTKREIQDEAAIRRSLPVKLGAFTKGFYTALFNGEAIERAYEFGCNRIQLDIYGSSKRERKLVPVYSEEERDWIELPQHEVLVLLKKEPLNQIQTELVDNERSESRGDTRNIYIFQGNYNEDIKGNYYQNQNEVLSKLTPVNKPTLSDFVNNTSLNFDNSFVYLLIELKPESSKINQNESEKFLIDAWLAIPESPTSYKHKQLWETFKSNRSYSQVEIEEKFFSLITECNQKLDEIKPDEDFDMAIEWILPGDLLSSDIDCWKNKYQNNERIGRGPFCSVHIRSSQRLHIAYKHCRRLWKKKWNYILNHSEKICLSHYIFASQAKIQTNQDLKLIDNEKKIIGINFPYDLQELENITYEFMIETGIPLALWSRCKASKVNHLRDLDILINPENSEFLNLQNLPSSVEHMRLSARSDQPLHLGHHLSFLWENPYNYPQKNKYKISR